MLQKLNFKPGFNKMVTDSGAESQWVDGDFVRFRYGLPEKIGGWNQLTASSLTLPGVARAQHTWTSISGEKYAAIGTSQGLFLYYGNDFYDISPLDTAITSCTFTSTTGSATVTINKTSHNLSAGRYFTFSSVTLPGGGATGYTTADFTTGAFEVVTASTNSFTITMASTESGTGMTAAGSASVNPYVVVGPTFQTAGYGWGTDTWSTDAWGTERTTSDVILEPGLWSLDNFGEVLIATISGNKTFTWNAGASSARTIRASTTTTNFQTTNNPTSSRLTQVSDRDRHLFHFGTETTIGDVSTVDPLFIRFSNQEDLNTYTPTSVNTAGSFRLDKGNKIVGAVSGKDYTLVLTDSSAYVIQFVGPPFTFSVKQVGTNCGLIGQNALSYSDGIVFWMSAEGGFFLFDGTVKSLPCLVEDFVFSTDGDNLGINLDASGIVYAKHNTLYSEVNWFYAKFGSDQIDRVVTYNYAEQVWTTGSLARTSYADTGVFNAPYATEYNKTSTPVFPKIQGITNKVGASIYYAHEVGTDQVNSSGTTAIPAFIQSGDYDITARRSALGGSTGLVDYRGDGEFFMSVKRFIPDFAVQTGNTKITLLVNDYPNNSASSSPLGPFTITSSTDKVDTRARGRLVALKIENDGTGETWRYGTLRLDAQPDGRR
jgi:hypothetical protein|tara:strand:+ start:284 stop:2254 length:1971 start_codon:yes stop_codon:yes gene_type:complete